MLNLELTEREIASFEADMAEQRAIEEEAWFTAMLAEQAPTVMLALEALAEPVNPCRGCPIWEARDERITAEAEAAYDAHYNR